MKAHTSEFKEKIKEFGREIDSKITYELNGETIELGNEDLNSVAPHYEGSILKSVMKQLDIDSNVEIPKDTILNYQMGIKTGEGTRDITETRTTTDDTFEGTGNNISDIKLFGDTKQDGIPTVDNPANIDVVTGEQTIILHGGKNLINANGNFSYGPNGVNKTITNGDGSITTTANFREWRSQGQHIVGLMPNTKYTLSARCVSSNSDNNSKMARMEIMNSRTLISSIYFISPLPQSQSITFTTPDDTSQIWISFSCYANSGFTDTPTAVFDNIQLEEGEIATEYEEYIDQSHSINLGKNLFDYNTTNIIKAYIESSNNKIIANDGNRVAYIKCKPNTTYCVSKLTANQFQVATTSEIPKAGDTCIDFNQTRNNYDGTKQYMTITTSPNANYLLVRYVNISQQDEETIRKSIQIEVGDVPTDYVNYIEPIELCKIGDYQDKIYKRDGKWYLHKEIKHLSLSDYTIWAINDSAANVSVTSSNGAFVLPLSENSITDISNNNMLSDEFKYEYNSAIINNRTANSMTNNTFCLRQGTNDRIYFRNENFIDKNVNEIKEALGVFEIYYVLSTPNDIEITNTELITQLNTISNSPTINGTNNIIVDGNLPTKYEIDYQYKIGEEEVSSYEYLDFGNYIVYDTEKLEDTNSYKITCYDKMLYSMIDYEKMQIEYPITIRNYINVVCNKLGLTFANIEDTFVNYNRQIQNELYLDSEGNSLNYTFRDVLDELAQATASTICINNDDELEIRYITDTEDTVNEEYLKDINVKFGEKYGPINSIVLSRAAGSDNVYLRDEESITQNGLHELKISDNQIMNFNDRSDYLPDILQKLDGLEYYINDFSSTGICYYEVCDRYNVIVDDVTYSCIMFNDDINITQGLEEHIHTDLPEETETDYTKADKTDRRINQTYIMVDKQNGIIEQLASKIVPVSNTISDVGSITLENAYETELHNLTIKGPISLLFPQTQEHYGYALVPSDELTPSNNLVPSNPVPYENEVLYPSSDLYPKGTILLVDDVEYKLDFDFLNYINNDLCDEFIYEDGKCKIIRRIGINEQGQKYAFDKEIIEPRDDINIFVKNNSVIKLKSFDNAILSATYLLENEYTENFATHVEMQSEITQTAEEINLEVSKKVNEDEVVSTINQSAEQVTITGNRFVVDSDNFKLSSDGHMMCNNGTFNGQITSSSGQIGGFTLGENTLITKIYAPYNFTESDRTKIRNYLMGTGTLTPEEKIKYDLDGDGVVDSRDYVWVTRYIYDGITTTNPGVMTINAKNLFRTIDLINGNGDTVFQLGLMGISTNNINANNIQSGQVSITPRANSVTSVDVQFDKEFSQEPFVTVTPNTGVPFSSVKGVSVSNVSATGCTINIYRTDTVQTTVYWMAML